MPDRFHRLRVAEVIAETADACSLVFEIPAELAGRFRHRPGQFLTLRVPSDRCDSVARCYSLSSAPGEPPKVTVKRTPDGYASGWIHDNIRPGDTLDVLPPAGLFTPRSLHRDLLLVAAGSGITPVMSILTTVLSSGSGRIVLIYANRDENSVIFAAALRDLAAAHPDRLTVIHWLESLQGLPSVAALRAMAAPYVDREAFICGPAPFMTATTEALRDLRVPTDQVHLERFESLTENPFLTPTTPAPTTTAAATATDGPTVTVDVQLDGEKHRVEWPPGQRLLDALLAAGLDAPYSCREGRCSACACLKLTGSVTMANNEVLDDRDLADGYILACQYEPDSPELSISYE